MILDARKTAANTWPVGSVRADLEKDLSKPNERVEGGRHPLPSLEGWCLTLGNWGITPETDVVVTDDQHGGLAAARCWWMLRAVGHNRVTVVPLQDLEVACTDVPTQTDAQAPYPATTWQLPTVDAARVAQISMAPDWVVLDARSAPRHRGEFEPLDPVAGCLPGAVNVPWMDNTDLEVARASLTAAVGDIPFDQVVVSCGSGVTACHLLLQMDRLGMHGASLYVGSWSEWCRR
jgi:thiosulfate/3-mercaptopyruvate sulfurtransferase